MAVEKFPDEISSIRALLAENPEGLTIKSISELLGLNRHSAATSLNLLQMQGRVTLKRIGVAKIYCPANKLPADAVLKLSNNAVIVFSKAEVVVEINTPFRELLQLERKDIIGKTTRELPFSVESHPELPRLIRDGLNGKDRRIFVDLVLNDRSIPCTITISPVFFESGDPGVALIADIPAGTGCPPWNDNDPDHSFTGIDGTEYICRFTLDGTLTYVNRAYCNLLQKSSAELIGHTWRPTLPENEYTKINQCLTSLDSDRPVASVEFKSITPGGDPRWQRWIIRNLFDQNGQSAGYMGTGTDITAVKNLEEKVRKGAQEMGSLVRKHKAEIQDLHQQIYKEIARHEKTHFQLQFTQFAMDHVSYLIMWVSHEGRLVYTNKEAGEVLGYPVHELQAKKFLDIISRGFSFHWEDFWEAIQRDQRYTLETSLMTRKGREIPVEMVLNFLEFKEKQYCCCFVKDITERKRADEGLRALSAYNRSLIEASPDPLVTINFEGKITDVNTSTEQVTGYSRAELIGTDFSDYFTEPYHAKEGYQQVFTNGTVHDYPLSIRHREGHITPVLYNATLYRDETGTVTGVFAAARDITERKVAEDALRESRDRFEVTLASLHDAVFMVDPATRLISECNAAATRIFGYSREEMVGSTTNFLHVDQAHMEQFGREALATYEDPGYYSREFEMRRRDGSIFSSEHFVRPVHDPDGRMLYVVSVVRDITGRKKVEEALKNEKQRLVSIIDGTGAGTWEWNVQTGETIFNKQWAGIIGYTLDELSPVSIETWIDHAHPEDLKKSGELLEKHFRRESEWYEFESRMKHKNGHWVWVLDRGKVASWTEDGKPLWMFGTHQDITERKLAEDTLLRVNQKLNVLSQLTRKDLTNQIFVLSSYLELINNQLSGQDHIIHTLEKGFEAVRSIHKTIEYSKDYQNMGAKPPTWQNVRMVLLLGLSHISISEIKHSLETGDLEIFADPLLEKVCQRLFENSVKHGGHVTMVRVWHTVTPNGATIVFEDDGIGIPHGKKEQIFSRGDGTRASMNSLIFVREILDITGITITENGEPGKGVRFEMTVPKGTWRMVGDGT